MTRAKTKPLPRSRPTRDRVKFGHDQRGQLIHVASGSTACRGFDCTPPALIESIAAGQLPEDARAGLEACTEEMQEHGSKNARTR